MAKFSTAGKPASKDINVTPLIDVVLVLLIIFMVITPVFVYEMTIKMPKRSTVVTQSELPFEPAKVAVCADGSFAFNGEVMSLREIEGEIQANLSTRPEQFKKVVFVDGHPDAPYPSVIQLIDTVQRAQNGLAEPGEESCSDCSIGIASLKTEEGDFDACGTGS